MPLPAIELTVVDAPGNDDRMVVAMPLIAFNARKAGPENFKRLAIHVRHPGTGAPCGGLWAACYYDWLFVELLFVPDDLRGQGLGSRLMAAAAEYARDQDCAGIWLDTFDFQARGFYEKLGFTLFGTLGDHPRGRRRFFLQRRLDGLPSQPPGGMQPEQQG